MASRSYRMASVSLLLAVTLVGSVGAQPQHQQHHPGGPQAPAAQPGAPTTATPPPGGEQMPGMMEHMQAMMEHMQAMMEHMQGMPQGGMMGHGGMMGRGGMMAAEDEEDEMVAGMPQAGMMGHGRMAWRHLARFTAQLELTEEQQSKVQGLVRTHQKEVIRSKAEMAVKKLDVRALLDAEPVEIPKVKELLQSIAAQNVDLHIAHFTLLQDIRKLLTPEQQQKFRTLRRQMIQGSGGMMGQEAAKP